jgi:hypothetical protein
MQIHIYIENFEILCIKKLTLIGINDLDSTNFSDFTKSLKYISLFQ